MIYVEILIVLVVLFIGLDIVINRMYQNKKRIHHVTPRKFDIPFEEIQIPIGESGQLYGWWIPASPNAPTLILVHGWGRNVARMIPYIRNLHPMGYNLLAFDARNHGNSTPEKQPTVWTFAEDTCSAVNFIIENKLKSSPDIGVIGLSVGGGAAINAAVLDQRIQSVITVGAFSHPIEVMKLEFQERHIPYYPFGWVFFKYLEVRFRVNFSQIAPINNIQSAKANIFLIHGDEDKVVPLEQGEALYKAGNPESTSLWVVSGKGHSNCNNDSQFWQKIETFLFDTIPLRD
jgi:pimeloyl-ACP methyl ester carboxylesterase